MKRITTLALALLLLLASCNGTAENSETITDETPAETTPVLDEPNFPDKDYGGYSFRVMGNQEARLKYMLAFETTGEQLNDAIYDANAQVMEDFNIRFKTIETDDKATAQVGNMIMAGGDDMDLIYMHDCEMAMVGMQGWFLNINDLPYVETSSEWWPQNTVDSLTLNGKMYYYSNFSSYHSSVWTQVVFFNKGLITDFGLENPYELVKNDKWTIDKAREMTENLYVDENGDGTRDLGDSYGLVAFSYPTRYAESFGIEIYEKTPGSSELHLNINNERIISLVDKLHNWFYGGNSGAWIEFDRAKDEGRSVFQAGRSLFTFDTVGGLTPTLLDTDVQFGMVPYPKIDEQQEKYYGGCNDGLTAVPTTTADQERTGIVIEAMAYNGYDKIMPAYIQNTLQARYATDEECSEMLEFIYKNQVLSFAYLFALAVPEGMQWRLIYQTVPTNNFASWYAQNEEKELAYMKILEEYYK